MKRKISAVLAFCLLALSLAGCAARPDDEQMDISQGYGENIKLIHLNGSSSEKRERIRQVYEALYDCYPLDKDPAMFAYYPDYQVTIKGVNHEGGSAPGQVTSAVVDVNGDWVDIIFTQPPHGGYRFDDDAVRDHIFRSRVSAKEFKALMNAE